MAETVAANCGECNEQESLDSRQVTGAIQGSAGRMDEKWWRIEECELANDGVLREFAKVAAGKLQFHRDAAKFAERLHEHAVHVSTRGVAEEQA